VDAHYLRYMATGRISVVYRRAGTDENDPGQRNRSGNHVADAGSGGFVFSLSTERREPAARPAMGRNAMALTCRFCRYRRLVAGQHVLQIEVGCKAPPLIKSSRMMNFSKICSI
jgi:hypothetical protein